MLTRYERRKLEAEWSSDDRSIANYARLIKTAVLSIMVLGVLWIAGTGERSDNAQRNAAAGATTAAQGDGASMRASQQAYDERRAQWKVKSAEAVQQAKSR
jgi:hypothetical protein